MGDFNIILLAEKKSRSALKEDHVVGILESCIQSVVWSIWISLSQASLDQINNMERNIFLNVWTELWLVQIDLILIQEL